MPFAPLPDTEEKLFEHYWLKMLPFIEYGEEKKAAFVLKHIILEIQAGIEAYKQSSKSRDDGKDA